MASVNYLGTLNNPEVDPREYLEAWYTKGKAKYVVGQLEKGAEGTVHIQFFINFQKPGQRLSYLKKFCSKAHFEVVKINNGAHNYCMKEDTRVDGPWEFGTRPVQRNSKEDWQKVYEEAKNGNFDAIDPKIVVTHYSNLKLIAKDHMKMPTESEELRGIWYWGEAGAGKSRKAMDQFPNAYRKMCNKWWDGYQGQDAVVMEDLDPSHKVLGHHLKIWADRYPFIGESKGGAVAPDYKYFVVTSQYHPEAIFEDSATQAAIIRRFKIEQIFKKQPETTTDELALSQLE